MVSMLQNYRTGRCAKFPKVLTNLMNEFFPFVTASKLSLVSSTAPAAFAELVKQAISKSEISPFVMVILSNGKIYDTMRIKR